MSGSIMFHTLLTEDKISCTDQARELLYQRLDTKFEFMYFLSFVAALDMLMVICLFLRHPQELEILFLSFFNSNESYSSCPHTITTEIKVHSN